MTFQDVRAAVDVLELEVQSQITALQNEKNDLNTQLSAAKSERDIARSDLATLRAEYDAHMATHQPAPEPEPKKILGMSAPASEWNNRIQEVGGPTGIKARRIFAQSINPSDQADLIEQAVAAGMMPVISYKGTPTAANCAALKSYLNSLGVPVTVTYHHEPHGDLTPATFKDRSKIFLDNMKGGNIKVGPILNGWLLDNMSATSRANFQDYTDDYLLANWDFIGIDVYQNETTLKPDAPAERVPVLVNWLKTKGQGEKKILIGEYNAFTTRGIAESGEIFLSTPTLWAFLVWNSGPTGLGTPLTGDRLAAFKATKADSRVLK